MKNTLDAIKKEEENYSKILKHEKKPEDIKNEKRDKNLAKSIVDPLILGFEELLMKYRTEIPEETKVTGEVDAKVTFPETQRIDGAVSIKNQVKIPAKQEVYGKVDIEFPNTQKVAGEVTARVQFPDFKKIFVESLKTIKFPEFPKIQKIEGDVNAKVQFPEDQKVSGTVNIGNIARKGDNARPDEYIPVRLTNGKQFLSTLTQGITQNVQSSGKVVNALERVLNAILGDKLDHFSRVARSEVAGNMFIEKFGRNTTVASGTQETIWDGSSIYSYPSTADITHAISTNANDTMDIEIQGLDANYVLTTQTITLTGDTQVALDTPLIRVFRARILGSVATLGVVSITDNGQNDTYAQIAVGVNQTNMAVYTVPAGKTGYLHKWYASILRATGTTAVAADVDIFRRTSGGVFRSTQPVGIQNTGNGAWQYEFKFPLKLEEKTDIEIRATPTANADISGGFTVEIVDN